jgi:signal transduction histidine kinase
VLTFSRHEEGKLRAEPHACVPASVISAVIEQFAPSFQRRALSIRCFGDADTPCLLDADALAQILANLLSNVEKYVPGGVVEIGSTLANDVLKVTVADEGPGISARDAERIFRPFERLDSRVNEGASGTGLGLAIARDLATSMGGTLRLLPSARGASFELRVSAPRAAGPEILSDAGPSTMSA